MTPSTYHQFLHRLRCTTLSQMPYLKPHTKKLAEKLHAEAITQKEALTLLRRLKKAGLESELTVHSLYER